MKQNKILHIELGAEAADVIGWMRSLPSRTINHTVNEILSSESRGKIRKIPHEFSYAKEDEHLSCGLVIRDRAALNFVAKIPKGEIKSTLVKIIRKHIRKNKELPSAPIGIHGGIMIDVLRNFVTKMVAKEVEYAGVPNKYSKLCEANDRAYHALRDEILACYKSVDENQGDANLRNLDCGRIIQTAFNSVFGTIEAPMATVATSSRDENHFPAQHTSAANKNTAIFVTNEDTSWWDDDYSEDDV